MAIAKDAADVDVDDELVYSLNHDLDECMARYFVNTSSMSA